MSPFERKTLVALVIVCVLLFFTALFLDSQHRVDLKVVSAEASHV